MVKEKTRLYLLSIVAIVAVVGIVVLIMDNAVSTTKDIAGEVVKATTKTTTKGALQKTEVTKKEFCGDKTCADGEHVSCYENTATGECECQKCKITFNSPEFQKTLVGKKSETIKSLPIPIINTNICREKRGAPVINAFMMDFLVVNLSQETLEDLADYLEIAYCDATNGNMLINITPQKYNWSKNQALLTIAKPVTGMVTATFLEYPQNFTNFQPFMEESWEDALNNLENDSEYGPEYVDTIKSLRVKDILTRDDYPAYYYYWLYNYAYNKPEISYYEGFVTYANKIGYSNPKYDLLIVLAGPMSPDSHAVYSTGANVVYYNVRKTMITPYVPDDQIYRVDYLDDGFYSAVDSLIHEIGHYTAAGHACSSAYEEGMCEECSWSNDVMSYCRERPSHEEDEYYNVYSPCSINFFKEYYIPNYPDGSADTSRVLDNYYSCE